MAKRIHNFSAGPAVLPVKALERVKENILNYNGSGLGVMELSHRGAHFKGIIEETETLFRELLGIPDNYSVLFTTGGATNQFSMIPMNLLPEGKSANFIVTGSWSKKALKEAEKLGKAHVAASSDDKNFSYIPKEISLSDDCGYLHFTSNNTIAGTQFKDEPVVSDSTFLVCDASSDFLHRKIDITKYGLVYAGAQKNLGPAGVTVVVVRNDLLDLVPDGLPTLMDYRTYAESGSLSNTPPTFPIYVVGEVLKWIKEEGGLDSIYDKNQRKAAELYEILDSNPFYNPVAAREDRSLMNVTFTLSNSDLEGKFLEEAASASLNGLKGHRSVGGMRASIYNAFPAEGVTALVKFMEEFADNNS